MSKYLCDSKKLKFLILITLVAVVIIAVVKLGFLQWDTRQGYEVCIPVFMPTIEKIGSQDVVLGGSGVKLSKGDIYQFDRKPTEIKIRLLDIDDIGATFIYEHTSVRGESGVATPHLVTCRSELFVSQNDERFKPRLREFLPQQKDFDPDWTINQYTEFVILEGFYLVQPSDVNFLLLDTLHAGSSLTTTIPYRIWIEVRAYDTKGVALEAFAKDKKAYYDDTPREEFPDFKSQSANYVTGCTMYGCTYWGQYDRYLLYISMSAALEYPYETHEIPLEDWRYIVGLAETRLLNGMSDSVPQ